MMIQRKVIVIRTVLTHQRRNRERVKVEDANGRQGGHVHGQGLIPDLGLGPVPGTDVDGPGHILDPQDDVEAGHVPILEGHIGGDHIPVPDADQEVDHIPVPEEGQEVGHIPAPGEDLGIHPVPIPVPHRLQKERKAMLVNKNRKKIVQSPGLKCR